MKFSIHALVALSFLAGSMFSASLLVSTNLSSSTPAALSPLQLSRGLEKEVHNPGFCKTSSTGYEILLESLLGGIFREADLLLGEGDILDVGAQFGEQACHFATLAPNRQVFAMDPSATQAESIRQKFASQLSNLNVINAGIGATLGTGKADKGFTGMKVGDEFPIETIDHVFIEQNRTLAFAHIDVEGRELEVLKGGDRTLRASKPIYTVEIRVHKDPVFTKDLVEHIDELGYDTYVVDEPCGWPHMDYRNLLCVPRSLGEKLVYSDTFNLAAATNAIFRVDSKSIFEKIYPECKVGGLLCPGNSADHKECCGEKRVKKWHEESCQKPVATQGFTYSKRATQAFWNQLKQRAKVA